MSPLPSPTPSPGQTRERSTDFGEREWGPLVTATHACSSLVLPQSQPRLDPGEATGMSPLPSPGSVDDVRDVDPSPSPVPAQARPGRAPRRLTVATFNGCLV